MISDWNWFFSSLAQSTAAIVGIFAAFIITKIVSNQREFQRHNNRISEILNDSKKLVGRAENRYFEWYNKKIREEQLMKLSEKIEDETDLKSVSEYYDELNFSPFDSKEFILESIGFIIENEKDKREKEKLKMVQGHLYVTAKNLLNSSFLFSPELHKNLTEERELIEGLIVDIKYNIRQIKPFLGEIKSNPHSSNLISYSIIAVLILFYVGVIYPLSFLPLPMSVSPDLSVLAFFDILFSLKGFILTVVTLIFSTIMIIFFYINIKLKFSEKKTESLQYYTETSNYSEYLKNVVT